MVHLLTAMNDVDRNQHFTCNRLCARGFDSSVMVRCLTTRVGKQQRGHTWKFIGWTCRDHGTFSMVEEPPVWDDSFSASHVHRRICARNVAERLIRWMGFAGMTTSDGGLVDQCKSLQEALCTLVPPVLKATQGDACAHQGPLLAGLSCGTAGTADPQCCDDHSGLAPRQGARGDHIFGHTGDV